VRQLQSRPAPAGEAATAAADVAAGLQRLALTGKPVCLHSSLRSFGTVSGGAESVIDGFLREGCTLIVPSFSWRFAVLPTAGLRPARNAWDYEEPRALEAAPAAYSPQTTEIDRRMGAIPAAVVARPDHVRGDHPLCSFTAIGPRAEAAVGKQTWSEVYAPLQWLVENDGAVLLAGVGLTSMTFVHYAEQLAGRTLFRRWVLDAHGLTRMVPVGSCSNGFETLAPLLAPLSRRTVVGASSWVAHPAPAALTTLVGAIRERPDITRCADAGCLRCRDAIAGGPLLEPLMAGQERAASGKRGP
jgi:aminoglycoside N3'-acetyltransferase